MIRIFTASVLGFLLQVTVYSATPTITNIKVNRDTNAAVVTYNVSPESFCWVRYGVASKTYLWSSATYLTGPPMSAGLCAVAIDGLKDDITYYFLPTARPNPDDEKEMCAEPACGAVEQQVKMLDASVPHIPAEPASVAPNLLTEPDVSKYAVVNLVDGGANVNHECVASAAVKAPAGYSWTIARGETLAQIIAGNQMTYGTVFQVPQGTTCNVKPSYAPWGAGYALPVLPVDPLAADKSIDAPNHRWIVFRTTPGGEADFPPFGTRTGPEFFSHYGGFKTITPNSVPVYNSGTIFTQYSGQLHHFWIENLKFSVDETQTTANYDHFFYFGNGEGGGKPPFGKYLVIRGNYFHGPPRANLASGTPSAQGAISGTMQGQIAIVGNYIDNLYYAKGALGAGITQGIQFTDCGHGTNCNTGGPALIDNNYLHGMAMNLYVESNNSNNPFVPFDFTVTHNTFYWPYNPTYDYAVKIGSYGCRNQIEYKGMARSRLSGNYINGQWACGNSGAAFLMLGYAAITDITISSNYITKATTLFGVAGEGNANGVSPHYRAGNRFLITNNLADDLGRGKYQAGGGGLGTSVLDIDTSASNITFENNTVIGPISNHNGNQKGYWYPWILNYSGGSTGQLAGLKIRNNIFPFGVPGTFGGAGINVQGVTYGKGVDSHPATPVPAVSVSFTPLHYANFLATAAGYTDASPGLGMQGASVIQGGLGYPNTGPLSFTGCKVSPTGIYKAAAGVIKSVEFHSFGSGCNPATYTIAPAPGAGTGAQLRPAYGLTPSYVWSGNITVCSTFGGNEMDMAACKSSTATMPSGDLYPVGPTTTARMVAAGLTKVSAGDYHCIGKGGKPCAAGVDIEKLESSLGIVSHIAATASGTSATISYLAPDARACTIDFSGNAGKSWQRKTDNGGDVKRSVTLTGLTPDTPYQYRLLCYFDQTGEWFSFRSEPTNMVTSGSFTTGQ